MPRGRKTHNARISNKVNKLDRAKSRSPKPHEDPVPAPLSDDKAHSSEEEETELVAVDEEVDFSHLKVNAY
jgi:hypothetical protein